MNNSQTEAEKQAIALSKIMLEENEKLKSNLDKITRLVIETRKNQKEYFATRSKSSLIKSKVLEKKLDEFAESIQSQVAQSQYPLLTTQY